MECSSTKHWHQLGRRCEGGYLAIPARFHDGECKPPGCSCDGEELYLAWLVSEEGMRATGGYVPTPPQNVPTNVPTFGDVPTDLSPRCAECGERPREERRRLCSACRKAAYRERYGFEPVKELPEATETG